MCEVEEYTVDLKDLVSIELSIVPNISGSTAFASLSQWGLATGGQTEKSAARARSRARRVFPKKQQSSATSRTGSRLPPEHKGQSRPKVGFALVQIPVEAYLEAIVLAFPKTDQGTVDDTLKLRRGIDRAGENTFQTADLVDARGVDERLST